MKDKRKPQITLLAKRVKDYFSKTMYRIVGPKALKEKINGYFFPSEGGMEKQIRCLILKAEKFLKRGRFTEAAACFYQAGNLYEQSQTYDQGLILYQRALNLIQVVGDRLNEGRCLGSIGSMFLYTKDYTKAEKYYKQSILISEQENDFTTLGNQFDNLGIVYRELHRFPKALEFHSKALEYASKAGNVTGAGNHYANLIKTYSEFLRHLMLEEQYQEVITTCKQVLGIAEEKNDHEAIHLYSLILSDAYEKMGNISEAISSLRRVLGIVESRSDTKAIEDCLNSIAYLYYNNRKYDEAEIYFKKAVDATRRNGNRQSEANYLGEIGNIFFFTGRNQEAENTWNAALEITIKIDDRKGQGQWISSLGNILSVKGEKEAALSRYEEALEIGKEIGDEDGMLVRYHNIANLLHEIGNLTDARQAYGETIRLAEKLGKSTTQSYAYSKRGEIAADIGRFDDAEQDFLRAIEIDRNTSDTESLRHHIVSLGNMYSKSIQYEKSIHAFQTLQGFDSCSERMVGLCKACIGDAYRNLGDSRKAESLLREGLMILDKVDDKRNGLVALFNLGCLEMDLEDYENALAHFEKASHIAKAMKEDVFYASCIGKIGRIYSSTSTKQRALEYLDAALKMSKTYGDRRSESEWIHAIASIKGSLGNEEESRKLYNDVIQIGIELNNPLTRLDGISGLGHQYFLENRFEDAVVQFSSALELAQSLGKLNLVADYLSQIGNSYTRLKRYGEAEKSYQKAIDIGNELKSMSLKGFGVAGLAFIEASSENWEEAERYYLQAISLAEESGDKHCKARFCLELGSVYRKSERGDAAKDLYSKALEATQHRDATLEIYREMAELYYSEGHYRDAIDNYRKALKLAKAQGLDQKAKSMKFSIGFSYVLNDEGELGKEYLGDFIEGVDPDHSEMFSSEIVKYALASQILQYTDLFYRWVTRGIRLAEEEDDAESGFALHTLLAKHYYDTSRFLDSVECYETAQDIVAVNGENVAVKHFLVNLDAEMGVAYQQVGRYQEARKCFEMSIAVGKETNNVRKVYSNLSNLGSNFTMSGDYESAIQTLIEAKEMCSEAHALETEGSGILGNLGIAYYYIGNYEEAKNYLTMSIELAQEKQQDVEDPTIKRLHLSREANNTGALGNVHLYQNDIEEAKKKYRKAIELFESLGKGHDTGIWLGNLALLVYRSNSREGITHLNEALNYLEKTGDSRVLSRHYAHLGSMYLGEGNFSRGEEFIFKGLEMAKSIDDYITQGLCWASLGRLHERSDGNAEEAIQCYKEALILNKLLRSSLLEEEHKVAFNVKMEEVYAALIRLYLATEAYGEAFKLIEENKSRSLIEGMSQGDLTSHRLSKHEDLLEQERNLTLQIEKMQRQLTSSEGRIHNKLSDVEEVKNKLNVLYDAMNDIDPEYVLMRRGATTTLEDVSKMLAGQNHSTCIIEYYVAERGIWIFLITGAGYSVKYISMDRIHLRASVLKFREEIAGNVCGEAWMELSSKLVGTISQDIPTEAVVYFVPHLLLHNTPLHALYVDGQPIIQRNPVAYIMSSSVLPFCRSKGTGMWETCAAFGYAKKKEDRELFESEAVEVAKMFGGKTYTGAQATKDTFNALDTFDIVHFSCHGNFRGSQRSIGNLFLNGDPLTPFDIYKKQLTTNLVTLSACRVGLSKQEPGDELFGFLRSLFYAGAPSVIATLWSVYAEPTKEMMKALYTYIREGDCKVVAMQKMVLDAIAQYGLNKPNHWAPFILYGDWE